MRKTVLTSIDSFTTDLKIEYNWVVRGKEIK